MEFSKQYKPDDIENKHYRFWEENGYFKPVKNKKQNYCIVIPPPNVTGILHMGHALNNTIQDILIRYSRMKGMETLWVPGTDHAGIATQNVVEKKIHKEGKDREDLGRENFLEKVWNWKEEHGNTIIHQLKKLGCSCDWSRTRFTMDEGLSRAVKETFIKLYEDGLIYRGNYIINWCPRCHTALSDEEVEHEETDGKLYYIRYPILAHSSKFKAHSKNKNKNKNQELSAKSKELDYVVVATTRPETMLGDTAIAVNPKDERFKDLKDKKVILPILNRELKVIEDVLVDPEFGTGVVKVTPAHDPNDFEMGKRHNLDTICIFNEDASLNENAGKYKGMDRLKVREKIILDLEDKGLIEKIEDHTNQVGHCYRCDTVIEPLISKQWFVKMKPLAEPAIKAVKDKDVKFHPSRWEKVYLNWMENIRDWCISRQIWWGHRLPVYYCRDCQRQNKDGRKMAEEKGIIVASKKPDKCSECGGEDIYQDEDVLDTWFSSWLWPFSTMGWPDNTKDLETFYPTDTLVTAQEIIFFWVARMIMSGLKFMDDIPFSDVYIHGTVRDDTGTKMSKSLGNVIDPIEIIEKFGADALRFSIISITAMGQDIFLSTEKFHLGRNFANKIWNASRLVFLNINDKLTNYPLDEIEKDIDSLASMTNIWILECLDECIVKTSKSLETYNFNQAADEIYHFFWHTYCDRYLELIKPILSDETFSEKEKQLTKKTMFVVLLKTLKLLHPFMPFITEEIYQRIKNNDYIKPILHDIKEVDISDSIMISGWPESINKFEDLDIRKEFDLVFVIITNVRNIKSELNIPLSKTTDLIISDPNKNRREIVSKYKYFFKHMVNVKNLQIDEEIKKPSHAATGVVENMQIFIPLEGVIDFDKEKRRLQNKLDNLDKVLESSRKKLDNKQFVNKAPDKIVEKEKQKYEKNSSEKEKIIKTLKNLNLKK